MLRIVHTAQCIIYTLWFGPNCIVALIVVGVVNYYKFLLSKIIHQHNIIITLESKQLPEMSIFVKHVGEKSVTFNTEIFINLINCMLGIISKAGDSIFTDNLFLIIVANIVH